MTGRKGSACHKWTDDERARLAEVAPGRSHDEIRAIMTDEFGDHFGGSRITAALKRYGIRTGLTGRFEKGNAGGFKSEEHRRAFLEAGKATRFRKGNMPYNAADKPIGTERVDSKDGYVWVKVAERKSHQRCNDNWVMKHHIVWEEHNGPIPPSTMIVFADHDKRNFDPGNLVAVPRDLWSVISHGRMEYWDAESLRTCMNIARLDKARYAVQCRPRPCRECGGTFEPRYANQRTCDACLGNRVKGTA